MKCYICKSKTVYKWSLLKVHRYNHPESEYCSIVLLPICSRCATDIYGSSVYIPRYFDSRIEKILDCRPLKEEEVALIKLGGEPCW